jgi:lipoyl(octanoyl) transferase 2
MPSVHLSNGLIDLAALLVQIQKRGAAVHTAPRGGQVTYHGPGQLVTYPIVNVRRLRGGPRKFVDALENSIIATLGSWGLAARPHQGATAGVCTSLGSC